MTEIARLLDSDEAVLRGRVERMLTQLGEAAVAVGYFTHWYTTRPPVHEAVVFERTA